MAYTTKTGVWPRRSAARATAAARAAPFPPPVSHTAVGRAAIAAITARSAVRDGSPAQART